MADDLRAYIFAVVQFSLEIVYQNDARRILNWTFSISCWAFLQHFISFDKSPVRLQLANRKLILFARVAVEQKCNAVVCILYSIQSANKLLNEQLSSWALDDFISPFLSLRSWVNAKSKIESYMNSRNAYPHTGHCIWCEPRRSN